MSEVNYWSRMRRRRLSRRTLLGASARAGVGAAGLALVGCGDDDSEAVGQQPQMPEPMEPEVEAPMEPEPEMPAVGDITRGGTYRASSPLATHDYFDPHRGIFGPTQYWMGFYMNYLIRWQNKEQAILEPDIASLPETPDEETYIFKIDQGARFWDRFPTEGGRAVTAQDIQFNVERRAAGVDATGAEDGTFATQTAYQKTASMEAIDNQTISLKTDGPDATYLTAVHAGPFSWVTSPEAADEFGDRWRDETTNVELSSGTGPFIPVSFNTDTQLVLEPNPNYWRNGLDGQPLPYLDRVEFSNFVDPTAVEAAYRANQLDVGGFPLSSAQSDGILGDFPEHKFNETAFGFTIINSWNYNPNWEGSDGQGNPFLDRRVAQAFRVAVDRFQMIDTVYLGSARVSVGGDTPWFAAAWTVPQDELLTWPGYRTDRGADLQLVNDLLDAAGYDRSRELAPFVPDVWEGTYAGITEVMTAMYASAGFNVKADVQPYTVILQRLNEGNSPGWLPAWGNPPANLDPTTSWNNSLIPGGSTNYNFYDYQPVTDIVNQMQVTLDLEQRQAMAGQVLRILAGVDETHQLDGLATGSGVMNGIQPNLAWPYVNTPPDAFQFAHASHWNAVSDFDTNHPDYPA